MSRIYASFADASLAEKAAGALLDYGVQKEDISLIRGGNPADFEAWQNRIQGRSSYTYGDVTSMSTDPHYRGADYVSESNYTENREAMDASNTTSDSDAAAKSSISTTTGADAGAGAAKGAGIGLGVGILAAIASIFVPGFGLIAGGGALAAALGGAAATAGAGAIAGGVTGYLKDQGVDEALVTDYENALKNGGALLEVTVPSGDVEEETARQVLSKYGATNVGAYVGSAARGYVS